MIPLRVASNNLQAEQAKTLAARNEPNKQAAIGQAVIGFQDDMLSAADSASAKHL